MAGGTRHYLLSRGARFESQDGLRSLGALRPNQQRVYRRCDHARALRMWTSERLRTCSGAKFRWAPGGFGVMSEQGVEEVGLEASGVAADVSFTESGVNMVMDAESSM